MLAPQFQHSGQYFYGVFRTRAKAATTTVVQPLGTRTVWWEPSWSNICPPHHKTPRFFLSWLLDRLGIFRNGQYAVLIIEDEQGRLIHRTCVFPAWLQFPFMRRPDVQLGNIFTASEWRKRGVAFYAIRFCLARLNHMAGDVYYVADATNTPSHDLALKSGFSFVAYAKKGPFDTLGYYRLVSDAELERSKVIDFSIITELVGDPVSQVQVQRLIQRYVWAAQKCQDCDVLDLACGVGAGMGLFGAVARQVIGADISEQILGRAVRYYGQRFNFCSCDAQMLPFDSGSFDVIVMFEAIYYLPRADMFFAECRRVLRPGGKILISTANRDLYDFNASLYSTVYLNPPEMSAWLGAAGFSAQFFGGDPARTGGLLVQSLRWVKFVAAQLYLIPESMHGKRLLRRLIFGKLVPMPAELTGLEAPYEAPVPIPPHLPDQTHRVLYCVAEVQQR